MTIPCSTIELENKKFVESPDGSGQVAIRTVASESDNPFAPPIGSDAMTATYPDNVTEVYAYRTGGLAGTIVQTVTVVYTAANKNLILNMVVT